MSHYLEPLEQRRLLTIPTTGSGSNLTLELDDSPDVSYITSGNDFLEIIVSGSNIQVRNSSGTVLDSRSSTNVKGININTQGGNDTVRIGTASGGSMPNLPVTIHGGTGNDTITGGNGTDQLFGDDGDDRLDGRAGKDVMDGGNGFDTADYSSRSVSVTVKFDGSANDGSNSGNNSSPAQYNDQAGDNCKNDEAVLGGTGADLLIGNSSANWIDGGGGNDTAFGGDGIDTIVGGVNTDLAYGEGGNDNFFMQDSTADQFLGGDGTTTAQYDTSLDLPAPAVPAALPAGLTSSLTSLTAHSLVSSETPTTTDNLQVDDDFAEGGSLYGLIGENASIYGVVVQPQDDAPDKYIAVGTAQIDNGLDYDFVLIRYNSDGTLDSTFGDGSGIVFTDATSAAYNYDFGNGETGTNDRLASIIIDDEGRLVVVGTVASPFNGESRIAVARYDADGTLDSSFGFDGIRVLNPYDDEGFTEHFDTGSRIAVQHVPDGDGYFEDYVVSGTVDRVEFFDDSNESQDETIDFGMTRLDEFGDTDNGFGGNGDDFSGWTTLDYFGADDFNTGLAIDGEFQNIWLSGYEQTSFSGNLLVGGFDSDGLLIPGAVGTKSHGTYDVGSDAMINGYGQLVVVGTTDGFYGTLTAFDINPNSGSFAQAVNWNYVFDAGDVSLNAVTRDNEGHGIAVGSLNGDDFYVYRFDENGLYQFGDAITKDFGEQLGESSGDIAYGVAVDSNGDIIVAGTASDPFAALVRFEPELAPPPPPPFVDVTITDISTFHFTYIDENGHEQPIPQYLVQRVTALSPTGVFEVFGTPGPDVIKVSSDGSIITALVNGIPLQVNASQVTGILVHALEGNDSVEFSNITVPTTTEGGAGNDSVTGTAQADEFHGGAGNDQFWGFNGDDKAYGDDDNDALIMGDGNDSAWGGNGRDFLIGGRGKDFLRGEAGEDILFGGMTFFDNVSSGFGSIFVEFASGHSLTQRVQAIGSVILRLGTRFSLFNDDNEIDNLGGGADKDWFIAKTSGPNADVITDFVNGADIKSNI